MRFWDHARPLVPPKSSLSVLLLSEDNCDTHILLIEGKLSFVLRREHTANVQRRAARLCFIFFGNLRFDFHWFYCVRFRFLRYCFFFHCFYLFLLLQGGRFFVGCRFLRWTIRTNLSHGRLGSLVETRGACGYLRRSEASSETGLKGRSQRHYTA